MGKNIEYTHFEDFIVRTPALHFSKEELQNLKPEELLTLFTSDPFFREGVFTASQVLYQEINKSLDKEQLEQKLISSLTKYYVRSKTRCTPFGLFAGCAPGKAGHETNVLLKNKKEYKKHIRLDMELVSKLTSYFSSLPEIQRQIKFSPNNMLYAVDDFYSYVESDVMDNKKIYFKSTTEYNEDLSSALDFCNKSRFFDEIVQFFVNKGFEKKESEEYVESLIESQILASELEISTLDTDPFKTLISKLEHLNLNNNSRSFIKKSKMLMSSFSDISENRDHIAGMEEGADIFTFMEHDIRNIFQTDLQLNAHHNTLSEKTLNKISKALNIIKKLSPASEDDVLKIFKDRFYTKYEGEEVPLLEALDEDFGLGYPHLEEKLMTPLLEKIKFSDKTADKNIRWSSKDSFLSRKLSEFFLNSSTGSPKEIEITDEDLLSIDDENDQDFHDTLSATIEIYKEDKEVIYVPSVSASAAKLLGRFSYFDESMKAIIKKIIKKEEEFLDNDTVFAEITHLPESREGNVILRPQLTDYEIPVLSGSLLSEDHQIRPEDLVLSVKDDRLVLRSIRLNKKIIPRLSSAHYSGHPKNLSIYKFLADFQYQDLQKNIFFDWGILGKTFRYMPRVTYKDIILSKAYWNIMEDDIKYLKKIYRQSDFTEKIGLWRLRNHIPDTVVIKDMDNKLYIDFNNELLTDMFLDSIKNSREIVLEEVLFNDNNMLVKNEENKYFTNEFIVNFYKKNDHERG
ncbi:hypothetical protein HNP38_002673 [Chryseobacterium defluvii]|uniref:Lantibiotic dehydratase N-terminal domain-containing protein n=1 Tax=Chryseobacterium defluvii TaxID=160396 RepID=A0A840KD01_9FLAO|nr:lantibiotic dehydratase family protein [Chryseobacterium defluvii]MBB4807369.1 hypothetical protein [Chryseobacterium defluvii]